MSQSWCGVFFTILNFRCQFFNINVCLFYKHDECWDGWWSLFLVLRVNNGWWTLQITRTILFVVEPPPPPPLNWHQNTNTLTARTYACTHLHAHAHTQWQKYTRARGRLIVGTHTLTKNHTDLNKSVLVLCTLLEMVIVVQDTGHCLRRWMHIIIELIGDFKTISTHLKSSSSNHLNFYIEISDGSLHVHCHLKTICSFLPHLIQYNFPFRPK